MTNKRSQKRYRTASYTNRWFAVMMAVLMLGAFSCKTGKQPVSRKTKIIDSTKMKKYGLVTVDTGKVETPAVVTTGPTKNPEVPAVNAEKQALIEKLTPLYYKKTEYSTFSGKAKMHYDGRGQKQDFTANIRMKKDQVIWVSISALGGIVNVARAYITPDSIFLVNYLEKEAFKMPIADANKLLPAPVDFATMQNLIIGDVLQAGGKVTDAMEFGGSQSIQVEGTNVIQQATYNKADNTMRSLQMTTADERIQGMIQYGNYEDVGGRTFSTSRAINLSNNGEPYYVDMNFTDANFDQPLEFPFSIPKSYKIK